MTRSLNEFNTLTFDCYGTLIDWETGIWDAYQPLLMHNSCQAIHRQQALGKHAELDSAMQKEIPDLVYSELLARVHQQFAAANGLSTSDGLDRSFGHSVPHWPAFPDSADALRIR